MANGRRDLTRRPADASPQPLAKTDDQRFRGAVKVTYTPAIAKKILRKAGYSPVDPYPGKAYLPWNVMCDSCKQPRRVRLKDVTRGDMICKHQWRFQKDKLPEMKEAYDKGASVRELIAVYGGSYGSMHRHLSTVTTMRGKGGLP